MVYFLDGPLQEEKVQDDNFDSTHHGYVALSKKANGRAFLIAADVSILPELVCMNKPLTKNAFTTAISN